MSYTHFCLECNCNTLDPRCTHTNGDGTFVTKDIEIDHLALLERPETPGTGIFMTNYPLNDLLSHEPIKIRQLMKKHPNELDVVCYICQNRNISLESLDPREWFSDRGCDPHWIYNFIHNPNLSQNIYNDE